MDFQNKNDIRRFILEKRDSVDLRVREKWNETIFNKLIQSKFYRDANVIFVFVSFGSEVDTHKFINNALSEGKIICVPKIKSKKFGMEAIRIDNFEDLKPGYYGILEPKEECHNIVNKDIDLILMPGVAFDSEGGRIGYGGGFYDRFISNLSKKVNKIALAYDFQVIKRVPMDRFDVKVDGIVTNETVNLIKKF